LPFNGRFFASADDFSSQFCGWLVVSTLQFSCREMEKLKLCCGIAVSETGF
jgi:hypothetical protein